MNIDDDAGWRSEDEIDKLRDQLAQARADVTKTQKAFGAVLDERDATIATLTKQLATADEAQDATVSHFHEVRLERDAALATVAAYRAGLEEVRNLLDSHQCAWEHSGDHDEIGELDEGDECRACEYVALLEATRALLATTSPGEGWVSKENFGDAVRTAHRGGIDAVRVELDIANADNAALLSVARMLAAGTYGADDYKGAMLTLGAPHPGAALLEELERLRKLERQRVTAADFAHLERVSAEVRASAAETNLLVAQPDLDGKHAALLADMAQVREALEDFDKNTPHAPDCRDPDGNATPCECWFRTVQRPLLAALSKHLGPKGGGA